MFQLIGPALMLLGMAAYVVNQSTNEFIICSHCRVVSGFNRRTFAICIVFWLHAERNNNCIFKRNRRSRLHNSVEIMRIQLRPNVDHEFEINTNCNTIPKYCFRDRKLWQLTQMKIISF